MKDVNKVFREATIRICRNTNLADALKDCKDYLNTIMPVNMMHIGVIDTDLSGARIVTYVTDEEVGDSIWAHYLM